MGIFSHKKQSSDSPQPSVPVASVEDAVVITAMPEKFLVADEPRFWTAHKLWALAVFFIILLIASVYWLLTSERFVPIPIATKSATTPTPTSPAAVPVTNLSVSPEDSNTLTPTSDSPGLPLGNSSAPNEANAPAGSEPVLIAPPATTVSADVLVLPPTKDTDVDGLTDAEEQLWHTDFSKPDTDGDGYTDLEELLHGYNPTGAGRLAASGLVKTYTALSLGILYPEAWTASPSDDGGEVQLIASPDEFMSLTTQPNPSNLSITDWYASVAPGTSPTTSTTQTLGASVGVLSPDERTFYFTPSGRPADVMVVNYNVGAKKETNFLSTFRVIVANLTAASLQ